MVNSKERSLKFNQSVVKAFDIIELLAGNGTPMRLRDISGKLGMNVSTTLRFLETMRGCGYIDQNPEDMRYYLTLKFCSLPSRINTSTYLRDVAHPHLHHLAEVFNECICLAVERNMEVVYIDIVQGADALIRSEQRIGNAASMHSTGIGKLFMLNYTEDQLRLWEREKGFTKYTPYTIASHEELIQTLEQVRKDDYAFDNEECEIGAKCIAVPIRDYTGKVVAGISVSGTVFRLTDQMIESGKDVLIQTAQQISHSMGYNAKEIKEST